MNTYAAHIINGQVTEVIVGTAEWATENLGGQWVDSPVKVGIGWTLINGVITPPEPPEPTPEDDTP
jgi:hypothetical protein